MNEVLNRELRAFIRRDRRAIGETTSTNGAELVPPSFAQDVIRLVLEFDGFTAACDHLETPTGSPYKRPQVSSLVVAGAPPGENPDDAIADGTSSLVSFAGVQTFDIAPTYVARLAASWQLVQDSNVDLAGLLASAASESISRQFAADVTTAVYGAATEDNSVELASDAVTVKSVAALLGLIDPGYLGGSALYVSSADHALLAADDITGLKNFPVPVVVTNAATAYDGASADPSGPVLANLGRYFTVRTAASMTVQVLRERYADVGQTAVNVFCRLDSQPRGEDTAAVFSIGAS